jgi:predicted cupin superfamily sugar epimerase
MCPLPVMVGTSFSQRVTALSILTWKQWSPGSSSGEKRVYAEATNHSAEDAPMNVQEIIEKLEMSPHLVEGGYFVETYRSLEAIPRQALPERYSSKRAFGTAIYYLLTPETVSALHKLESDEIFHFYLGDPVSMLQLHPDGSTNVITLGQDILAGQQLQVVAPHGSWQGTLLQEGGEFALLGCTMAPGFDWSEYEAGDRVELLKEYPEHEDLIVRLTPQR